MSSSLYVAASGSIIQEKRMEIIANNLANANAVGFKRDKCAFQVPKPEDAARNTETTSQTGLLAKQPFETYTDYNQGPLMATGNPLDLGLSGDGFFVVKTPDGERYTRSGNFVLNTDKTLVTQDGHPVVGDGGPIVVNAANVTIDETGAVIADGKRVGALKIVDFPKPYALQKEGGGLFKTSDDQIEPIEATEVTVNQGFVEGSNINPVVEMTEMIETVRGYESYQRIIQFLGEINAKAANEVGRLG